MKIAFALFAACLTLASATSPAHAAEWQPGSGIANFTFNDALDIPTGPAPKRTCTSNADNAYTERYENQGKKYAASLFGIFLKDFGRRMGQSFRSHGIDDSSPDGAFGNVTLSDGRTCRISVVLSTSDSARTYPAWAEAECGFEGETQERVMRKEYGHYGYLSYGGEYARHAKGTAKCPFDD